VALLDIQNLTIEETRRGRWLQYQGDNPKLIDDLSLSVAPGQCVSIVGEKTSGKLPLVFALQRIIPVTTGRVLFDGEDIHRLSERRFRKIRAAMPVVFPDEFGALDPHRKLRRTLLSTLAVHTGRLSRIERENRIEKAMERAGANLMLREKLPGEMSPPERQRAALARALLLEPRLLVCLDVTSGLDAAAQASLLNRLSDLRERLNLTLLLITHDLAIADHMSDSIGILSRGRIVESGSPEQIVNHPEHEYTRQLVSSPGAASGPSLTT